VNIKIYPIENMPSHHVSDETRAIIIRMYERQISRRIIAECCDYSVQTISNVIDKHLNPPTTPPRTQAEINQLRRLLSKRDELHLLRYAILNPKSTLGELANPNICGHNISTDTVRRTLARYGYVQYKAWKKPYIKPDHRKARLAFARQCQHYTADMWKKVLFSDESSFVIGQTFGRQTAIRKKGELPNIHHMQSTFRQGRDAIMVWGGIWGTGKTQLYIHNPDKDPGTGKRPAINGEKYVEILKDNIVSPLIQENLTFQQDGAPIHKCKVVQDWIAEEQIPVLIWPASSPDLNPIEHIWAHMKRTIFKKFPGSRPCEDMIEILQQVWDEIDEDMLDSYFQSMPARCEAVMKAKGGPTRY